MGFNWAGAGAGVDARVAIVAVASAEEPLVLARIPKNLKRITFGKSSDASVRLAHRSVGARSRIRIELDPTLVSVGVEPFIETEIALLGETAALNCAAAIAGLAAMRSTVFDAANLAAIADMRQKFPALDLVLIESGGDNLAATFSPELADLTIYVIDVAAGDKIPSKGGPGITRSDLLVINKVDLAPHVGASLETMERESKRMRGARPFFFTNLRAGKGVEEIAHFIEEKGGLGVS